MSDKLSIRTDDGPKEISIELLADILECCGESAIGYWAQIVTFRTGENPALNHMDIVLQDELLGDDEENPPIRIGIEEIRVGIERILLKSPGPAMGSILSVSSFYQVWNWLMDSINEDDAVMVDADVADVIVQYYMHNETRYS